MYSREIKIRLCNTIGLNCANLCLRVLSGKTTRSQIGTALRKVSISALQII